MTPIVLRVKELREKRGWSQSELARQSGVTQQTISKIELRQTEAVAFEVLERLADALDVHPGGLIQRVRRWK